MFEELTPQEDFKIMALRLEPQVMKGVKVSGYLETFNLPITIPDIIENVAAKYGGGKFVLRVVDVTGKYVRTKVFEISGVPKIPKIPCNCSMTTLMTTGCRSKYHI